MKLAALVVATGLLVTRTASANQCNMWTPNQDPAEVPAGCALTVYVHPSVGFEPVLEKVSPTGERTAIAADYGEGTVHVEVEHRYPDPATCADAIDTIPVDYKTYVFSNIDAQVGDTIAARGSYFTSTIVAAGDCPPYAAPYFFCDAPVQAWDECRMNLPDPDPEEMHDPIDDGAACNAGGASSGLLVALGVLISARRCSRSRSSRG